MTKRNKNILFTGIIFLVAFLIEMPLSTTISSLFYFAPQLSYLLQDGAIYLSVFISLLFVTRQYFNASAFFKVLAVVVGFGLIDVCSSYIGALGLVPLMAYCIFRPIIAILFVWLGLKWITKSKFKWGKTMIISGAGTLVLQAVFNILEYIHIMDDALVSGNNLYSSLIMLMPSLHTSAFIISLSCYAFLFISFICFEKYIGDVEFEPEEEEALV